MEVRRATSTVLARAAVGLLRDEEGVCLACRFSVDELIGRPTVIAALGSKRCCMRLSCFWHVSGVLTDRPRWTWGVRDETGVLGSMAVCEKRRCGPGVLDVTTSDCMLAEGVLVAVSCLAE